MSKNKNIKPIHKWNNGNLATLCHQCNCIASLGHTEDLYCKECNKHKKEFARLIEMDGVLFDTYLDKPYEEGQIVNMRDYPTKILMVKGFENEEPKQETLTYTEAAKKEERIFNSTMMSKQEILEEAGIIAAGMGEHLDAREQAFFIAGFIESAKWQQEQDKKCFHPLPYRLAKSDVNYECTLCGKFI
jgi:hypothetical protein